MSDMKNKMVRRKHVFIDPSQQVKFCIDLLLHALLFPLLVIVLMYVEPFCGWLVLTDTTKTRSTVLEFIRLCQANWWIPMAVLTLLGFISVLFSHKIIGPIYRCRMNLERVMNGESDVHFGLREGDYFKSFADFLSDYVKGRKN